MLNIPVILGSVREGRKSEAPAKYIVQKILDSGHKSQLVDFKDLPLPFVDSPKEPSEYKKLYPNKNVQKWSDIADAADGFVFVAPEYNHGYSGVLKNALDWLYPEFKQKAAALVGVSNGAVGGARAIENLRPIMGNFSMYDIRETVMFVKAQDVFNAEGKLLDESFNKKIDGMLKSLFAAAEAMKETRIKDKN